MLERVEGVLAVLNARKPSETRERLREVIDAANRASGAAALTAAREPLWYLRQIRAITIFDGGRRHAGGSDIDGAALAADIEAILLAGHAFGRCGNCHDYFRVTRASHDRCSAACRERSRPPRRATEMQQSRERRQRALERFLHKHPGAIIEAEFWEIPTAPRPVRFEVTDKRPIITAHRVFSNKAALAWLHQHADKQLRKFLPSHRNMVTARTPRSKR